MDSKTKSNAAAIELPQGKTIQAAVLTVSDPCFRGAETDLSGPAVVEHLLAAGIAVKMRQIAPGDYGVIVRTLETWCKPREELDLIITTGGTGLSLRDVTPEATLAVVERLIPGIPEALRAKSFLATPDALLCRGVAGTRGTTLIINLPQSVSAVQHGLEVILAAVVRGIGLMGGRVPSLE